MDNRKAIYCRMPHLFIIGSLLPVLFGEQIQRMQIVGNADADKILMQNLRYKFEIDVGSQ